MRIKEIRGNPVGGWVSHSSHRQGNSIPLMDCHATLAMTGYATPLNTPLIHKQARFLVPVYILLRATALFYEYHPTAFTVSICRQSI